MSDGGFTLENREPLAAGRETPSLDTVEVARLDSADQRAADHGPYLQLNKPLSDGSAMLSLCYRELA